MARSDDVVLKYHESIRRAMVDWADEVFDRIADGMPEDHRETIERLRADMLAPLRRG